MRRVRLVVVALAVMMLVAGSLVQACPPGGGYRGGYSSAYRGGWGGYGGYANNYRAPYGGRYATPYNNGPYNYQNYNNYNYAPQPTIPNYGATAYRGWGLGY